MYLDCVRHIEAAALGVSDVQPGMASSIVKQVPQLFIIDLQQLYLDLVLTLQSAKVPMNIDIQIMKQ